jgi:DNA end-binding protein Ku
VLNKRIKSKGGTTRVEDEPAPHEDATTNVVDFISVAAEEPGCEQTHAGEEGRNAQGSRKVDGEEGRKEDNEEGCEGPHHGARQVEPCRCTSTGASAGLAEHRADAGA